MRAIHPQRGGIASLIARARPAAAASPPSPICLALCTPPACSTRRAHAASLVRRAGPRSSTPSSTGIILAATDTFSSSCARMTLPLCLHARCVRVVCARARDAAHRRACTFCSRWRAGSRVSVGARGSSLVPKGLTHIVLGRGIGVRLRSCLQESPKTPLLARAIRFVSPFSFGYVKACAELDQRL